MRNSVVLNQVFEDPVCAILFEMEYVVSVPIPVHTPNTPNKKSIPATKRQHETQSMTMMLLLMMTMMVIARASLSL